MAEDLHAFLATTIRALGPWAIPCVLAAAGLVAMANKTRLVSGFGVMLILGTAALVLLVIAFQTGRI